MLQRFHRSLLGLLLLIASATAVAEPPKGVVDTICRLLDGMQLQNLLPPATEKPGRSHY